MATKKLDKASAITLLDGADNFLFDCDGEFVLDLDIVIRSMGSDEMYLYQWYCRLKILEI